MSKGQCEGVQGGVDAHASGRVLGALARLTRLNGFERSVLHLVCSL